MIASWLAEKIQKPVKMLWKIYITGTLKRLESQDTSKSRQEIITGSVIG